MIIFQAFVEFA